MYASHMRAHKTPIETPLVVRAGASALIAIAVAALSLDIPRTVQAGIMVAGIAIAVLLIFSHAYRRSIRAYCEERGVEYKASAQQILPLFPVWLALMVMPAINVPIVVSVLIAVAIFAWMWLIFPHIDGTRKLAYIK